MSEQLSPKAIIAESIIENFEAVSSYVARQSLRDMLDENQALRAENARLREALEEMAGNLMGSPKRKLMLSDDDFWQTPGEHTLRQWLARVALQSEREQP